MKNISQLTQLREYRYVLRYAAQLSENGEATVNDALSLFALTDRDESFVEERIRQAYVMCRYMKPGIIDIVTILTGSSLYALSGDPETIFLEKFGREYLDLISEIDRKAEQELEQPSIPSLKNKSILSARDYEQAFDYYAMEKVCDRMYDALTDTIKENGLPDGHMVFIACQIVKKVRRGVIRPTGEPFLSHPLIVAKTLADIRIKSTILAAALLHDIGSDPDYTTGDIQKECNKAVADLVDAVNAIQKECSVSGKSRGKRVADDTGIRRLERMINSSKYMIYALYIKAADIICSLSAFDPMSSDELPETAETAEIVYLPLLERFGMNYFVDEIRELMFRANDPEQYEAVTDSYRKMADVSGSISALSKKLNSMIRRKINDYSSTYYNTDGYTASVYGRELRTEELTSYYYDFFGTTIIDTKLLDRKAIPVGILDIVVDDKQSEYTLEYFLGAFTKMFLTELSNEGYSVANVLKGSWGEIALHIEDRYRRRFICRLCMRTDYSMHRFGRTEGFYHKSRKAKPVFRSAGDVTVILLDGKQLTLPAGSTVLDCAFAIHPDLGICLIAATINEKKASIFACLHNGDRVRLIAATHKENGKHTEYTPNARLYWIRKVKTETALKELSRYFERKYHEGDNPDFQHKCNDETVRSVAATILPDLADIRND